MTRFVSVCSRLWRSLYHYRAGLLIGGLCGLLLAPFGLFPDFRPFRLA